MKKIVFVLFFLCLFLVSCNKSNEGTFNKVPNYFYFPIEVDSDLDFPDKIELDGKEIALSWHTSDDSISSTGVIERRDKDVQVTISVTATIDNESKTFDLITVTVLKKNQKDIPLLMI